MHLDAAGDVTDEAGNAEAHVAGVAHLSQQHCGQTDDQAGQNHPEVVFHFRHEKFLLYAILFSQPRGTCSRLSFLRGLSFSDGELCSRAPLSWSRTSSLSGQPPLEPAIQRCSPGAATASAQGLKQTGNASADTFPV